MGEESPGRGAQNKICKAYAGTVSLCCTFSKVAKNQICTHSWETRVPCRLSICVYLFQKQKLSTFENLSEKPIHSHPLPIFSCEVYLNQTRLTRQLLKKTRIFFHSEHCSIIPINNFFTCEDRRPKVYCTSYTSFWTCLFPLCSCRKQQLKYSLFNFL